MAMDSLHDHNETRRTTISERRNSPTTIRRPARLAGSKLAIACCIVEKRKRCEIARDMHRMARLTAIMRAIDPINTREQPGSIAAMITISCSIAMTNCPFTKSVRSPHGIDRGARSRLIQVYVPTNTLNRLSDKRAENNLVLIDYEDASMMRATRDTASPYGHPSQYARVRHRTRSLFSR